MKSLIFLITIIAATILVRANEIIPIWNKTVEAPVQDMEFLKGQDEIIMIVGEGQDGRIQLINPENGDLIHSYPESMSFISRLAITPDSTRFIHISGNIAKLRNIDNEFSTINQFFIPQEEDSILLYFKSITIDPTRPIAYVTTEGWDKKNVDYADKYKVVAFNYETGEIIKDITPYGSEDYPVVEVSTDGKYLAIMNDGQTYLKIWDLEQDELILNEPLYDEDSQDNCKPEDIYFSKIDESLIYYSGLFTKKLNVYDIYPPTIYTFNIKTDIKEIILPNDIYGGWNLILTDNEERVLSYNSNRLGIINLSSNTLEWYNKPPKNVYSSNVKYNNLKDYFIGISNSSNISKFKYDRETSIHNDYFDEIIITPNPTQSVVNISIDCNESEIGFSIYNVDSVLIYEGATQSQTDAFNLDFSPYPTGVYFLTFICNNAIKTYKIIKEG